MECEFCGYCAHDPIVNYMVHVCMWHYMPFLTYHKKLIPIWEQIQALGPKELDKYYTFAYNTLNAYIIEHFSLTQVKTWEMAKKLVGEYAL